MVTTYRVVRVAADGVEIPTTADSARKEDVLVAYANLLLTAPAGVTYVWHEEIRDRTLGIFQTTAGGWQYVTIRRLQTTTNGTIIGEADLHGGICQVALLPGEKRWRVTGVRAIAPADRRGLCR